MADLYEREDMEKVDGIAKFAVDLDTLNVYTWQEGKYQPDPSYIVNEEGDIVVKGDATQTHSTLARQGYTPPTSAPGSKVNLRNDSFYSSCGGEDLHE